MRILQVTDFFPPVRGGLEFHVDELTAELARRRHDVHVATLTRNALTKHPGVTVHTVPSGSWLLPRQEPERPFHPPVRDPLAARALRQIIAAVKPDIVHGHNWLAVSLPKDLAVPLVYTAHDYGQVCQLRTMLMPSGVICTGPEARKCLKCGTQTYGAIRSSLLAPATTWGRRSLDPTAIIAVGNSVRDALKPWVSCPIRVIHNFLSSPGAPIVPPHLPERFFAFAGDPRFHKGLERLLEIWRQDPPDAALLLALTRPTVDELPAGVSVIDVDRQQLLGVISKAVALIVPSRWPDPCPSVIFEAFSVGTPVIASNVGGLPDIVRPDLDGLLVNRDNFGELRKYLDLLLVDPVRRSQMSLAAEARSAGFSSELATDKIEELYVDLLSHGRIG